MASNRLIIVTNLNFKADEQSIRNHFEQAGEIKSIDIMVDKKGMSKGVAYIEYKNADDARKSIKMFRKSIFMNKTIDVFFSNIEINDEQKNKKSFFELPKTFFDIFKRKNTTSNENILKRNKETPKRPYIQFGPLFDFKVKLGLINI